MTNRIPVKLVRPTPAMLRPRRSWEQVGKDDAANNEYRPPESYHARVSYQFGWEQVATDTAWKARLSDD